MQGHRRQTKFTTSGNPTVTSRLHAVPSPPFARLGWGKRDELLQRLEFFETVFLWLLAYDILSFSGEHVAIAL